MAENGVRSEDVLGQKWDRCVSDTAIKFGIIWFYTLQLNQINTIVVTGILSELS